MEVTPRNNHRGLKVGAYASGCPYTATASPLLVGCGLAYLLNRNQYPDHHSAQSQLGEQDTGTHSPGLGEQGLMALTNSSNGKTPNDPNPKPKDGKRG